MKRRIWGTALLAAVCVGVTGCTVPPVTTAEQPDGTVKTLTWADYPGHAYADADDILAASDIDEVQGIEQHGRDLLTAIQGEVRDQVGIRLEFSAWSGEWREYQTNGYGSPSLLASYSCCSLVADVVPVEFEDWTRVYDIVAQVSAEFGAGAMVREQDQDYVRDNPDQMAEFEKTWTTGVDGGYSLLSAWTTDSGQSVMLTIEDPQRRLVASAEEKKNPPRISIDYSATVVERGKRSEFEEELAPFVGAAKPDSTEWD